VRGAVALDDCEAQADRLVPCTVVPIVATQNLQKQLSAASNFVNGQVIYVDGGVLATL
jgi:hypothetical protein